MHRASGIPCALYFEARTICTTRAHRAPRECEVISGEPSLRGALATKQSNLFVSTMLDCFASLAMTLIDRHSQPSWLDLIGRSPGQAGQRHRRNWLLEKESGETK